MVRNGEDAAPQHTVVLSFDSGIGPTWRMGPCPYEPDAPARPCRPQEPGFESVCNFYEWWEGAGQDILVGDPITFSVTQEFDPSGWGDLRVNVVCGAQESCEHGPSPRFSPNDVGHRCRRDSVIEGVCIDCESAPSGGDARP